MNLLLVIYGSLAQISGGYLYDRKVTDYLREHNCRVDVLSLRRLAYPLCRLQSLNPRLRRLLRRPGCYDIIILDELIFPSLCDPALRRHPRAPRLAVLVHHLAVSEQSPSLPRAAAARLERRLLAAADAVLVNSRTTAAAVGELIEGEKPITVCSPGCDALALTPEKGEAGTLPAHGGPQAPRLLITGNIIPRKGHLLLLEMLAELKELPWELRVVGRATDRGYLRRLRRIVRREGLEKRMIFTGALEPQALAREYARADIFLFPSSYEGFGISLCEAVRAGLPCLAFAAGAMPEWAGDAVQLVPAGDRDAFKDRLQALIRDPALRLQAARASRRLAAELPAWGGTGRCFLAALEALLKPPAEAPGEGAR